MGVGAGDPERSWAARSQTNPAELQRRFVPRFGQSSGQLTSPPRAAFSLCKRCDADIFLLQLHLLCFATGTSGVWSRREGAVKTRLTLEVCTVKNQRLIPLTGENRKSASNPRRTYVAEFHFTSELRRYGWRRGASARPQVNYHHFVHF